MNALRTISLIILAVLMSRQGHLKNECKNRLSKHINPLSSVQKPYLPIF